MCLFLPVLTPTCHAQERILPPYLKPKRRFSEYNLKDMTLAIALVDYSD
jgi:hypothetical protein